MTKGLMDEVKRKYMAINRIFSAGIEVTHRCPCDCRHCFVARDSGEELSTDEMADLLRQLAAEGAMELGFTGGEVFLREDFPQILELARRGHFTIEILTTGVLIGPAEVALLRRLKMKGVEMSLLGAVPETHEGIMRFPGAFERLLRAVRLLREADIPVTLKTTVLRPNWKELPAMARLAQELGAGFRASVNVLARSDHEGSSQELGLTEEEVARCDPKLIGARFLSDEPEKGGAILVCGAGKSTVGVSPQGDIFPCILLRHRVGNIREKSLKRIWHDEPDPFLVAWRSARPEDMADCYACAVRPFCNRCPGSAYLESSDVHLRAPHACVRARGVARAARRPAQP